MPGKVNPSSPSPFSRRPCWAIGLDSALASACAAEVLELNPFLPLVAHCLLGEIDLLTRACSALAGRCVCGDRGGRGALPRPTSKAETAAATALVQVMGYEKAAGIAAEAAASRRPIRDLVIEKGILTAGEFDRLTGSEAVCALGARIASRGGGMTVAAGPRRAWRLQIGILGRRNVGKSRSPQCRHPPAGFHHFRGGRDDDRPRREADGAPAARTRVFIDTAGIDDEGLLGDLRVRRTRQLLDRVDHRGPGAAGEWGGFEENLLEELRRRGIPVVAVFKQGRPGGAATVGGRAAARDGDRTGPHARGRRGRDPCAPRGAAAGRAARRFREPADPPGPCGPGRMAVLVVPIDKRGAKGRLILPQVQAIRDPPGRRRVLPRVKERELRAALASSGSRRGSS
jgi:hypothetical protein